MTLAFLVFFPMVAAVISYLIGRSNKAMRDNFVILSCLVVLGVAVSAVFGVLGGTAYTLSISAEMSISWPPTRRRTG